jgi:hypothetical protein
MKKILPVFFPHSKNDHKPHALRHYSLIPLAVSFVLLQINLTLFHSSSPQILSFATSIYQEEFFQMVNKERTRVGLDLVEESATLNAAARLKARDMFEQNYWAHVAPDGTTPWDFFRVVSYDYTYAGENLAKDFNTTAGVVAGWMSSPSHRDNLLNRNFEEMGIAVVNGVLLGEETTLVVQLFGTPPEVITVATTSQTQGEETATKPVIVPQEEVKEAEEVAAAPLPEEEVTLQPESVYSVIQSSEEYRPQGVSARLLAGIKNLRVKASLATNPQTWSSGQQVAIFFFLALILVLVGDSAILWYKGIKRQNSHSMMHAGILGLLIILTMINGIGVVV